MVSESEFSRRVGVRGLLLVQRRFTSDQYNGSGYW